MRDARARVTPRALVAVRLLAALPAAVLGARRARALTPCERRTAVQGTHVTLSGRPPIGVGECGARRTAQCEEIFARRGAWRGAWRRSACRRRRSVHRLTLLPAGACGWGGRLLAIESAQLGLLIRIDIRHGPRSGGSSRRTLFLGWRLSRSEARETRLHGSPPACRRRLDIVLAPSTHGRRSGIRRAGLVRGVPHRTVAGQMLGSAIRGRRRGAP